MKRHKGAKGPKTRKKGTGSSKAVGMGPVISFPSGRSFQRIQGPLGAPAAFRPIGPEKKFVDLLIPSVDPSAGAVTAIGFAADTSNVNMRLLNGVVEGAADYQRVGTRCEFTSIQLRLGIYLRNGTAAITQPLRGRLLLVYDRQPNGSKPNISEIITSRQFDGGTNTDAYSMVNMANRDRFMILREYNFVFSPTDTGSHYKSPLANVPEIDVTERKNYQIEDYVKLKGGLGTQYKGATGAIGDIATGAFYLCGIGEETAGSTSNMICEGDVRMRYLDR